MITLIVATSQNRVIGKDGKLIKHIPGDLPRFKKLTIGHPIVMGRKTFESIGRPLPNRTNIVLSRSFDYQPEGVIVYRNLEDILSIFGNQNIFIIGGGEIYKMFLPLTHRIELTLVEENWEGDTFFPELNSEWIQVSKENCEVDGLKYSYITLEKKLSNNINFF